MESSTVPLAEKSKPSEESLSRTFQNTQSEYLLQRGHLSEASDKLKLEQHTLSKAQSAYKSPPLDNGLPKHSYSWWEDIEVNSPQTNSLSSGKSKPPRDYEVFPSEESLSQTFQNTQPEYLLRHGYALQRGYLSEASDKLELEQHTLSKAQSAYKNPPLDNGLPKHSYSWWEDIEVNSPQTNSLSSAIFIFASGGMSLAWSLGFASIYTHLSGPTLTHVQICWFIAVILGACLSTILFGTITKHLGNILASILVMVNGSLFILASENVTAAVVARYCDGMAFGLTVIPTIVIGSEQSVKRIRGYVLSVEQVGLIAGMHFYMNFWQHNRMHGILALICGVSALVLAFMYKTESPISYLRKGDEDGAVNALRQLQKHQFATSETYSLLNENKRMLEEDIARGRAVNVSIGLIPMLKLCLFRALVSMSLSLPLLGGFVRTSALTSPDDDLLMLNTFAIMRLIGEILALYTLDTLGRRPVSVISLLFGGGLLIGVGFLFSSESELTDSRVINSVKLLLLANQVFAGLAAPACTCYLGEAFSISVKPYFILIAIVFENIIQIMICCQFNGTIDIGSDYEYVLGTLQIGFAFFFIFGMPETKQTSLREALVKFTKIGKVDDRI